LTDSPRAERVIASEVIYRGRIVSLRADDVELPDGRTARREIVEHADVVAVVPMAADGRLVLVRQYRLAARSELLEVPAGGVDEGEEAEAAAQRELQEETGYRAGRLQRLTGFFVSPGYCTEFIHVFLAEDLRESALSGDEDEDIELEHVTFAEALRLIETGEIRDGKSIIGILLAAKITGMLR